MQRAERSSERQTITFFDSPPEAGHRALMLEPDHRRTFLMGVIVVLMVAAVGYVMRPVLVPLVVALFFAMLARPAHRWLCRFLPNSLAMILVTLFVGALLIAIPVLFAVNIQAIVDKMPEYEPRITAILDEINRFALGMGVDLADFDFESRDFTASLLEILSSSIQGGARFLGVIALVLFTMIFMLAEAPGLRAKLALAINPGNQIKVQNSMISMRAKVTAYLATKTLISLLNGVGTGLFTWALGIDFPFVWGVLTFTLYYIPNVGALIALVPPVLLAFIQFESPTTGLVCLTGLTVVYNLVGNVLEPRLLGRTLSLSPLVVFVSLLFWGWYWGIVGVVLSVPLTVAIRIVCEHVEALKPIAILMGEAPAGRELAEREGPA